MKRRTAIKHTALGASTLLLGQACKTSSLTQKSKQIKDTVFGVQLFTIPSLVDQDLKGTLQLLSEIGYKEVEFFGPYPFSAEATKQRWDQIKQQLGLKNYAFYGYTVQETATMLNDFGLTAPSFHTDLITMRTDMIKMLDELSAFQTKYIVLPVVLEGRDTLDDYKKLAAEFNRFGEQMSKYDIQFVYHNHGYEHIEMGGAIPMHYLLQNTSPTYVQFELDIFWMQAAGASPVEFIKAYPDRYKLLHLKDASAPFRFAGDGGTPDQWMAGFPKMSDPGDGVYDIAAIIEQAKTAGVQHYFLEWDLAPDPMNTLKNAYANLRQMG